MKKNLVETIKGPATVAGGYAGSSIYPRYQGYKDEDKGSTKGRLLSAGTGSVGTALVFSPQVSLSKKSWRSKLLKRIGNKNYRRLHKYGPAVGAVWGALSGLGSYETMRLTKNEFNRVMKKKAGIIDSVKPTLAPDLFDENQKLYPEIRQELLDLLYSTIPPAKVKLALIGGSITSFQYSENSDIDISVYVEDPPDSWLGSMKSTVAEPISYRTFETTNRSQREFQYYVVPWNADTQRGLENRDFGLYDIINDRWHTPPQPREAYIAPEQEYSTEMVYARARAREWEEIAKRYKTSVRKFRNYSARRLTNSNWNPVTNNHLKRKAQYALKDAHNFSAEVFTRRHYRYSLGYWGIPRESLENVVFKLMQYGPYGKFFKDVSEIDIPSDIDKLQLI